METEIAHCRHRSHATMKSGFPFCSLTPAIVMLAAVLLSGRVAHARLGDEWIVLSCNKPVKQIQPDLDQIPELVRTKQYRRAHKILSSIYSQHGIPLLLYNIARLEMMMGEGGAALDDFRDFLAFNLPEIEYQLLVRRAQQHIADITGGIQVVETVKRVSLQANQFPVLTLPITLSAQPAVRVPDLSTPVYRKWGFWTIIGTTAISVVTLAGVLGSIFSRRESREMREIIPTPWTEPNR